MKYLILDDLDTKRERIAEYIKSIVPDAEIEEFCCSRDFMCYMKEYWYDRDKKESTKDYLLFLDWNFPFYANDIIEPNEGEHILHTLQLRHIPMKVVVVSSEEVNGLSEFENVLGQIVDDCMYYQKSIYEKFIEMAKEESL